MKEIVEKFFDLVSHDKINSALAEMVLELETDRNAIRKESLIKIEELDPTKDGQKIKTILLDMNRDITFSYEKENFLRDFINKFK